MLRGTLGALLLAATQVSLPAGAGLGPLTVKVDLAGGTVVANGVNVPIKLDRALFPSASEVVVEDVPIAQGKHVAHVRIPAKDAGPQGPAWEAILAAGESQPIFAGMTGLAEGDPGERTGKGIRIVPHGATSVVVMGTLHEELNICGRTDTLLDPQGLDPSLKFRGATFQRLDAQQIQDAKSIEATDKGATLDTALAKLLVATGSSVPDSRGAELTDGDPQTVWSEQRPGIGQGEFVLMAGPQQVPIARMEIVVVPPKPASAGAAPKQFFLVTNSETFAVTIPGDAWAKPGQAYEIKLPQPIQTSCLALVLGDADARGQTHPEVGLAELVAYSEFDTPGMTLESVAKLLSSPQGDAARAVLQRAGKGALEAVERAYDALDERGRARAIDVAASHENCDEAAGLLAKGMCEKHGEAPRKAKEKLQRCKQATPALVKQLHDDPASRMCVAPTLVELAHDEALIPIADALETTPEAERATREVLRTEFSRALGLAPSTEFAAHKLGDLLADKKRSATARLEMMRAAGSHVVGARVEAEAALDEILQGEPSLRARYLSLGPLAELARGGDPVAAKKVASAISHDPDWAVRREAAKLGAGLAEAGAPLLAAAKDPEPRVREEALGSLATGNVAGADAVAASALQSDGWTFVKVQALRVLEKTPASPSSDAALADALLDRSTRVRAGALVALAMRRATGMSVAIRARLDDKGENADVRAAAARALGAVCDASSTDRLTELVKLLGAPGVPEDEQLIALGALEGLAALQPRDLRNRIAPLLGPQAPAEMRAAAQKALSARSQCH
jgi:hypothetical protein